jgi:hypothetical protein
VNWFGAHIAPPFGGDDRDQRHIRPDLIALIAEEFKHLYFIRDQVPGTAA